MAQWALVSKTFDLILAISQFHQNYCISRAVLLSLLNNIEMATSRNIGDQNVYFY